MSRIRKLLCLLLLIFGQRGFADNCAPCFNWCDLSYSVYADYLYWKVTRPDGLFLDVVDVTPSTDIRSIIPPSTYSSGYRVGGAVFYNCFDFDARYTFLRNTFGIGVNPNNTSVVFQQSSYHLNYHTLDLTFGYTYYFLCNRGYIQPYFGTKLAWLRELSVKDIVEVPLMSDYFRSKTNAYGLLLGIESRWDLFRCCVPIFLIARGDLSVLSATSSYTLDTLSSASTLRQLIPLSYAYFPFVADFYIGLGFDLCNFALFSANLQIGYEAQAWMNVRDMNDPLGFIGSLGLGGLVVHGNVIF